MECIIACIVALLLACIYHSTVMFPLGIKKMLYWRNPTYPKKGPTIDIFIKIKKF